MIVSGEGPIDEQVHDIVGPQGVGFAIDPVAGQIGTEIFHRCPRTATCCSMDR